MYEQLIAWIRRVAALNDLDLEEELKLVNNNSVNSFARAIGRIRRPEFDSHSYRNSTYEAHPHADTINLLLSIGESTLSAINSETPVSSVPYGVSPHMDVNARIKVLCLFIPLCLGQLFAMNVLAGEDGWTVMKQEVRILLSCFDLTNF